MATLEGRLEPGSSWAATWTRPSTSGAFLLIRLSRGELHVPRASFPTSSGCPGGGAGLDGGGGSGVSEGVTGVDPDSEVERDDWLLTSDWSNLNTSKSVMSKSCPVPQIKVDEATEGCKSWPRSLVSPRGGLKKIIKKRMQIDDDQQHIYPLCGVFSNDWSLLE